MIRFHFLGLEKNVQMRSLDTVDENARLMRFAYHYVLDGTEQDLTGEVRDGRLRYQIITGFDIGEAAKALAVIAALLAVGLVAASRQLQRRLARSGN